MNRIDRYMLRQFFQTLILWYICLAGLYVIFDLFANMDGIIAAARENGNVLFSIARYYFFQSFQFFDILISMLIMISAMITLATMIRHNELVPMMAAGVSQLRIVVPIIGAAVLVTFLAMACRELLLPRFLEDLLQTSNQVGQKIGTDIEVITDRQTGIQLYGTKAHWHEKRIEAPNFSLPSALRNYGQSLQGEDAFYQPANDQHPAGFLVRKITKHKELLASPSLKLGEKTVILTPKDADFLASDECFVITDITFDQLAGGETWRKYGSTVSLIQGVRNPSLDLSNKVQAVIHARVTQPILDMTLLFLGLPIILTKTDRNVFKALGISALIVILFLVAQMTFRMMGNTYPAFGAWMPVILFVPLAMYLFYDVLR